MQSLYNKSKQVGFYRCGYFGINASKGKSLAINNGLVLFYDAGNPSSYPGSGTTIFDLAGFNSGNLNNGVGYSAADGGQLTFDGGDDYVNSNLRLPSQNYCTIGGWFKSSRTGLPNRFCGNADATTGLTGIGFMIGYPSANRITVVRRTGTNIGTFDIDTAVTGLGTGWHYIAASLGPGGLCLYYDGVLVANNVYTGLFSGKYFTVGDGFLGSVGLVHVYNRALTTPEILANFNLTKARFGL
jgi:hypothetical protein